MMSRRALAAAFTLSVCGGGEPARAAGLPERPLGATATAVGDSRTIAAWTRPDGRVDVLLAGRRARLTVSAPACPTLVAAGARHLLFECDLPAGVFPPPPRPYVVLNPRTGAQRAFTITNPYAGDAAGAEPRLERLGDHWAQARVSFHTALQHDWVAWRTGKYVKGSEDPFGPLYRIDLDRPQLGRKLCRPFTRPTVRPDDWTSSDRYGPSPLVDGDWVARKPQDARWVLGRCGSKRRIDLGRDVQEMGGGYVVYDRDGLTRLRRLRDGRVFRLRALGRVLPVGGRAVVWRPGALTLVRLPR
jgi:hypothetical protein